MICLLVLYLFPDNPSHLHGLAGSSGAIICFVILLFILIHCWHHAKKSKSQKEAARAIWAKEGGGRRVETNGVYVCRRIPGSRQGPQRQNITALAPSLSSQTINQFSTGPSCPGQPLISREGTYIRERVGGALMEQKLGAINGMEV